MTDQIVEEALESRRWGRYAAECAAQGWDGLAGAVARIAYRMGARVAEMRPPQRTSPTNKKPENSK
jgi:hypothetical protein